MGCIFLLVIWKEYIEFVLLSSYYVYLTNFLMHTPAYMHTATYLRMYNKMTMEVILSTAFGRAVDVQGGQGGRIFEAAVTVFNAFAPPEDGKGNLPFKVLQFLPCKLLC